MTTDGDSGFEDQVPVPKTASVEEKLIAAEERLEVLIQFLSPREIQILVSWGNPEDVI